MVVKNIFHWTQNPTMASRIAKRKDEIYDELLGGVSPAEVPGSKAFLETLRRYDTPVALAAAVPQAKLTPAVSKLGLTAYFDAVVTAEDSGAPEVEYYYMYGAEQIQRPCVRCVVVGDSNRCVPRQQPAAVSSSRCFAKRFSNGCQSCYMQFQCHRLNCSPAGCTYASATHQRLLSLCQWRC